MLSAALLTSGCVAARVAGDVAEGAVNTIGAGVDAATPDRDDKKNERR